MTTARAIGRSGPEIRAVLAQVAPEECARFEAEFKTEAGRAAETFDAAPLDALLDRWWGVAVIRANPLTETNSSSSSGHDTATSPACTSSTKAAVVVARYRAVWPQHAREQYDALPGSVPCNNTCDV